MHLSAPILCSLAFLGGEGPKAKPDPLVTELVAAHNRERAGEKLAPLTLNDKLRAAASAHAKDMASNTFMAHEGSDGSTPAERVARQEYHYIRTGENVASGQREVEAVVKAWMNSPHHRDNILGDFTEIGVAMERSEDGTAYWSVSFGTPLPQFEPEEAAAALVEAVNKARAEAKKKFMSVDPKLAAIAQRHAEDSASQGKLARKDLDGLTPFGRMKKQGLRYQVLAQSDASGQPTAKDVIESWLKSESHKNNVLGSFGRIGVGYSIGKDGTPYWSVLFGKPFAR